MHVQSKKEGSGGMNIPEKKTTKMAALGCTFFVKHVLECPMIHLQISERCSAL
jgi:hypothetical protein